MAVDHVKSTVITNLDATPVVQATAGQGAGGQMNCVIGHAVAVASSSANSTYQLARVPWTAKVQEIHFESAAQAGGTFDLGVYHATDGRNGQATALLAADAVDQDLFAAAIAVTNAVAKTDVTNESTTYTIDKRQQPLWEAAGLTENPGGFADIVATVVDAITTGTGRFGITVKYVD